MSARPAVGSPSKGPRRSVGEGSARHQPAILAPVPPSCRFLVFALRAGADRAKARRAALALVPGDDAVIGLGRPLVAPPGLLAFPALAGPRVAIPSTQGALFVAAHGADPGASLHRRNDLAAGLDEHFELVEEVSGFRYGKSLDLSGYEDGTENPKGKEALRTAIVSEGPRAGASFVAVQRWVHDLPGFFRRSEHERDHVIGRARVSNEELDDAPLSAHVKRSAQEDYPDGGAFMVRRSMPYGDGREAGLEFVAFGASTRAFELVLRRMVGLDDGVTDALFSFSRPVSGGYYLCPALDTKGRLVASGLG